MKDFPTVAQRLREDSVAYAIPNVVVSWNMNRIYSVVAENTPLETEEGFAPELFPISSIVEPRRPLKGINKARVGSSTIGDDYLNANGFMQPRFYVADPDDLYKYWTSPVRSDANGALTKTKPFIIYSQSVKTNKIVIKTENSWATAKTFSVQTTSSATPAESDWSEIANQTSLGNSWKAKGEIVLYYSGTNWTAGSRVDGNSVFPPTATIRGIRMVVTALEGGYEMSDGPLVKTIYKVAENGVSTTSETTGKNSYFDLIEMSARLEVDLSKYVISIDDTSEMSEASELYPMGQLTTNQGSIQFSNLYDDTTGQTRPGLFSPENGDSPFSAYLDSTATFTASYDYYASDDFSTGQPFVRVPQFIMFSSIWSGQEGEEVSVALEDENKFFNETTPLPALWEGLTVPQIIWRLMDSIGFNKYSIDQAADKVTSHIIPVFYTNGEDTVSAVLDELSKASQTAIYFDSLGVLNVKTRDFALSPADTSVATLSSEFLGSIQPSIISVEQENAFEPNHYSILYQSTNWSEMVNSQPVMQKVWEPEGTVTLRACPILRNLSTTSGYFHVSTANAKIWPYEGIVNIEGELMTYRGKEFVYHTGSTATTRNIKVVVSADEYKQFNELTPADYRYKNYFTGGMYIVERGLWNSEVRAHYVEATGYNIRNRVNNVSRADAPGFTHLKDKSQVQLESGSRFKDGNDYLVATRGSQFDSTFLHYGTKMRLVASTGKVHQCAGIVINNNDNTEDGYFIEITPSSRLNANDRKTRNELMVYSRVNGKTIRLNTGAAMAIGENIDYEIDVTLRNYTTHHKITVWVNGRQALSFDITGSNRNGLGGRFGMHLRGQTMARYEYLYAIARNEPDPPNDFSYLDKVTRGYTGGQWDKEWVYGTRTVTRRVKKKLVKEQRKWNQKFFDEFGPIVHELRQMEVKFDPAPVLHSRLYSTNDWGATVLEYRASPFEAVFIIANTNRANSILNGEDTLSFAGTDSSVDQVLTVLGRPLIISDAESIVAKNDSQIRARGKIEAELSSPWIQSKDMAQSLADWMTKNFSYGNEMLTVEIFGNPLIEVGDVVTVNYPDKHLSGDYFVLSTNSQFQEGLSTTLTLRKRIIQA